MEAIESGDAPKRCLDDGAPRPLCRRRGLQRAERWPRRRLRLAVEVLPMRKGAKIDATDDDGVSPLMLAHREELEDTVNTPS